MPTVFLLFPPASKGNREVANLTERKNLHTPVYLILHLPKKKPGTPVFAHYTSARRWYVPRDMAKVNNSEIERVSKMDNKKF